MQINLLYPRFLLETLVQHFAIMGPLEVFAAIFLPIVIYFLSLWYRNHINEKQMELLEKIQKAKDAEDQIRQQVIESERRKDALEEKKLELDYQRSLNGQEHMYSILKDTFSKVEKVNVSEAVYSAFMLQNLQVSNQIDSRVLDTVAAHIHPLSITATVDAKTNQQPKLTNHEYYV